MCEEHQACLVDKGKGGELVPAGLKEWVAKRSGLKALMTECGGFEIRWQPTGEKLKDGQRIHVIDDDGPVWRFEYRHRCREPRNENEQRRFGRYAGFAWSKGLWYEVYRFDKRTGKRDN